MTESRRVSVPETLDGSRADKAVAMLAEVSRAAARELIESGHVTVNGTVPQPRTRVATDDALMFELPAQAGAVAANPAIEFDVLYEDEHLAVLNKPPNLVVHPGVGHSDDTLVSGLLARWPSVEGVGQPGRWGVVHRLDRDTSGAILVALTGDAYRQLVAQLAAREVRRSYVCLVHGSFEMRRGTIDAPIGRDPVAPMRMAVDREGRPARTHYRTRESFPASDTSLLDVELESGRTHQIRVHLASIGHPVVGDTMYRRFPPKINVPRMFLHAARLGLTHPDSGEILEVEAPLPSDLSEILDMLRSDGA